jgi:hypothetical protein
MKKFIPIIVVCILVLSGLGAAAFSKNVSIPQQTTSKNVSNSVLFSTQPMISEKDGFVEIEIDGATTHSLASTRPILPIYVKTYQIPFGSTGIQVVCSPKNIQTMTLTKEILPARASAVSKMNENTAYVKDSSVYGSAELYPATWYAYELGAGRNENDRQVTFVKVICYPVRYSPLINEIEYAAGFDINVVYTEPVTKPKASTVSYDMVIIAPSKFESGLQTLIDFKNTKGVATTFKSVESIYDEYTGADQPEQVKKFIQYAYDNWNITYVLLVGGLKNHLFAKDKDTRSAGWKAWWVPVRYVSIPQDDDEGCLSDLYYGCLYNATGVFDSWDSNGDGVFAAWGAPGAMKDKFDMYPEVYVSRLPIANTMELKHIVTKITTYEGTGPEDKSWYTNFVGVGGKTFDYYEGKPDGEYLCDLSYNYTKLAIPDLKLVPVYSSNRDTGGLVPNATGIAEGFNQGAGFVDFEGHGYPLGWNTIWFDGSYDNHDWVGGTNIFEFKRITNKEAQPVVVVGGCHNAMYNITILSGIKDKAGTSYFCFGYPGLVCFSWGLVIKPRGSSIAATGCTGYGMGYQGIPVSLSGELEVNFFKSIGEGSTHFGEAIGKSVQKFVSEEEIGQIEAFVITNWASLGDPSLVFGGY